MNVDENSELRDGDKGFAACYKTEEGSYWNSGYTTINNDDPKWVFLDEVKAVKKGTAVKATDKKGWLETGQWNKNDQTYDQKCSTGASVFTGDLYYLQPFHDSMWDSSNDYLGFLSEDGFKGTGLNNGENHLKCWTIGYDTSNFMDSGYYNDEWEPSFDSDDGQSLAGWASTGTAQVIHLDDTHKRIPYSNPCSW